MSKPLRIGLVGAGWVARPHVEGWLALKEKARVTSVADVNLAAARELADPLGATAFGDYRELLAHGGLDAVDICVPPHLHVDIVPAAAALGLHVLCEKPLACDLQEADRIGQSVQGAGITYRPAHNSLFYPTTRLARAYLDHGDLAEVYFVRTSEHYPSIASQRWGVNPLSAPEPDYGATWRGSRALLKGGALMDGGYHPVYRLLYLARSEPVTVHALMARFRRGVKWEAEDTALVSVRFSDGSLGEVLITYAFDSLRSDHDRLFAIAGQEGILLGNEHSLYLKPAGWSDFASQSLSPLRGEPAWRASIAAEIEHFAESVLLGRSPIQTFADARRALRVVRAAYESVERGTSVELEP
jgi:predicted dehydrogenase